MKQQIIDKITSTVGISGSGLSLMYVDKAAEEIVQLMCYREVRVYMLIPWQDLQTLPSYSRIEKYLLERYPIEVIQKAIEQVKNELK